MRIMPLVASGLMAMLATGCLQVEQTLTIDKRGGGNIDIKYAVSEQSIHQLQSMRKLTGKMAKFAGKDSPEDDASRYAYMFLIPREDDLRKECERYKDLGIELKELKVDTRGAWRHVDLKLDFDDLAALPKTEAFKYVGFSLVRNQEGHYVFYQASEPGPDFNPPDITNDRVMRQLTPILAGFKVAITLKTPGPILKTNADRRSTFSSMWSFDFDRDPAALIKLQKHKLVTIFNSSGLDLPEIRVDNADT